MQYPHCTISFQPQNGKKMAIEQKNKHKLLHVHQFCTEDHRLVIAVYEYSALLGPKENEAMEKSILLKF